MKRVFLMFTILVGLALRATAQVQGGNISGTVTDSQGLVLPGATVTARGVDASPTKVTDGTGQYRFLDLAPGVYQVTVELSSFQGQTREAIVVVGRTTPTNFSLRVGTLSENLVVTAPSAIVDPTVTGTSTNFTIDELKYIPTSRDPFALMRTVPGVLLDQVNVGGNETGQQALVLGKATRQQDTSWTIDGVEVTDVGAPGQSPTYFNYDSFEEIQVSTAGNDIRSRTGGVGINLITKRGGNQFHGGMRGYFSSEGMESSNVPDELKNLTPPVTPDKADHTIQNYDYGFEFGGPLIRNRAWFFTSISEQDIRIYRRTTSAIDRTTLRNPQLKVNWQATQKDMINFVFFNGYKLKDGRANNAANASSFEEFEATHHQDNAYSDAPLHGLWKIGDDRTIGSNILLSAKYAYYNTGLKLTPEGGTDSQAGRNVEKSLAYGSTVESLQIRPQHSVTADANQFVEWLGRSHNFKYGFGFRHVENRVEVEWPGNGIVAIEQAGSTVQTSNRAQVYRQSKGANTVNNLDAYIGDSIALNRFTIDAALRFDRQWGVAVASTTDASKGLPTVVPGVVFPGYDAPFIWENFSPRFGVSYMVDQAGRTIVRASYSKFTGQLAASAVGARNPSTGSTPGFATYPWNDLNADHFAQASEVDTSGAPITVGGGFTVNNPTGFASSTVVIDRDIKAPVTQTLVLGVEHELRPNLAVRVDYTYDRTSDLFGNLTSNLTPRLNVRLDEYVPGPTLTGTLPDGSTYSVPTYATPPGTVNAGFVMQTIPGFYSDYHGLELNLTKRLSNRWMGRLSLGFNNASEHFSDPAGRYNTNGNPTGTPSEPLIAEGTFAPTPTVVQGIFMNSAWQFNANGMYQAPYDIEVAANIFGRQGYPMPMYRGSTTLGLDTNQRVLVAPLDQFRLENVWLTDIRVAKPFHLRAGTQNVDVRLVADVFNLFNANTILARTTDLSTPATFNAVLKNVSPRIMRLGLVVSF